MEQDEAIDESDVPEQRPRRSWPFTGRPPSNRAVFGFALVYGVLSSCWSERERPLEPISLWRDSPALAVIYSGTVTLLFLGALYLMLRAFLPQCKPRVTRRWRSQPLVFRTVSLAESIIIFHTLQALPVFLLGCALGMMLTAAAGLIGINRTAEPGTLAIMAAFLLVASLVAWKANRDAERANYEPFVKIRW